MLAWFKGWLRQRRLKKLRLVRRKQAVERAHALELKRLRDAAHKAQRAASRARKRAQPKQVARAKGGPVGVTDPDASVDRDFIMPVVGMLEHLEAEPTTPPPETFSGKGGTFGGAGASGSWDDSPPDAGATAAWIAAAPHAPDYLRDVADQHWQAHVINHYNHSSHGHSADVSSHDNHSHTDSGTSDWSSADSSSYSDGGSGSSEGSD